MGLIIDNYEVVRNTEYSGLSKMRFLKRKTVRGKSTHYDGATIGIVKC
jgi:hypothetical protein